MFMFLYLLAAMGVAYWAKTHGRNAALWLGLAIVLTPLGASLAIMAMDRWFTS